MGRLAKLGIFRGKKVPVEGILGELEERRVLNDFEVHCLGSFGVETLANKVLDGVVLAPEDIELLLGNVPLSALLKLLELKQSDQSRVTVVPSIFLPLEVWLRTDDVQGALDRAFERLDRVGANALWIFTDLIEFSDLESEWPDVISEILRVYPNTKLVAPPVGVILKWLSFQNKSYSRSERSKLLGRILKTLQDLGFTGVAESAYRNSLGVVQNAGFDACILTRLDRYMNPQMLTRELLRVRSLSEQAKDPVSWCAGIPHLRGRERFTGAALDLLVLRVLAVGTLSLPLVKKRRGFSRFLQIDSFQLFDKVGVNEYAFAAVDRPTRERFGLPLLSGLHSSMNILGDDLVVVENS